jgi:hypothetical protein
MKARMFCIRAFSSKRTYFDKDTSQMKYLPLLIFTCLLIGLPVHSTEAAPKRPNILFAIADDMGRHGGAYAPSANATSCICTTLKPTAGPAAIQGLG